MSEYTPNLNAAISQFKDFGLSLDVAIPDNPKLDGSGFSRCPLVGKPRANTDGAYKLHTDGRPAGVVHNHSTGIQETWKYDDPDYVPIQLTPEQIEQQAKEQRQNKELREKELAENHAEAAKKALFIWNQSKPLTNNQSHQYLVKKGIKGVYSIRVNHYQGNTSLVIPVGKDGAFSTLQFINPDGSKTFLKGGKKSGCYSILNKMESPRYVAIGEGFGTVATILDDDFSQEKGVMGVMALDAGNLEAVAVAMREKYPTVDIFIFGDKGDKDDKGEKAARAAAKACGGYCVLPPITKGDFNDYLIGDNVTVSLFDLMMQAANATIEPVEINQHTTEPPSNAPTVENGSAPLANENNNDWENPNEMVSKKPPVQPLTAELIPEPYRLWLADVSHRMQTPPDFATVSAIVITGSLIGSGCAIRPKQLDNWEAIPNLWGGCVSPPSTLKSPSMNEAMKLLERVQAEYSEKFEQEKIGADFDAMANKAFQDDIKTQLSKVAKGKDGAVNCAELQRLKAEYAELTQNTPPEPKARIFKTNEVSVQSMTALQNENPRGVLMFRDELTGLLVKWDREDGQDERAYFLEGWNGNGSYTDNKIGRGMTHAKNVCISLLGGIQPDKLNRYLYQAQQGNNDGLIQRLQLAVYPDELSNWQLIDTSPNKAEKERAYSIMKTLAEIDFIDYGAVQGEHDDRPYFHFDDDGQAVFNQWFINLQTEKLKHEDVPIMIEHLSKYRSLMPSLALIFHCIDIADGKASGNVSGKAARLAVQWCDYLETHARRIYAMVESPEYAAAVRLAAKIKAKALPNSFTAKLVYDKGWHGLKNKQEVEAACNILIDENWLMMTRVMTNPLKGRPLIQYQINPKLFKNA
jgi:phage/plasmid primase-like uncharacterized protein